MHKNNNNNNRDIFRSLFSYSFDHFQQYIINLFSEVFFIIVMIKFLKEYQFRKQINKTEFVEGDPFFF